ncbi:hypothetical protein N8T08_003242 [Aspergillus melleus]|uniref:Uncharacterized protein n=1 Tax=Aspergillus melleus TaxID=138277 RepID=A0ACC3B6L1_9EURO|nr:hypothetical protein N8T08_003242 [Aspergillus melleus]
MGNGKRTKTAGKESAKKCRSPRLAKEQSVPSATAASPFKQQPVDHNDTEQKEREYFFPGPPSDECLWFGTGPAKEYKRWGPLSPNWAFDLRRVQKLSGSRGVPWTDHTLGAWSNIEIDVITEHLRSFAFNWTMQYAVGTENAEPVEELMSADQKQAILDSLDGYCITKEWDTFLGYLPQEIHTFLPSLLTQALLSKEAFDTILANPFFFVDTMDNRTDEIQSVPPPLGLELYKTWKHIRKINIVGAEEWRCRTLRMFCDARAKRCYNESVVLRIVHHRKSAAELLAKKVLSESHPVYPLLCPLTDPDQTQKRLNSLVKLFDMIAILATWAGTEERGLLLTPINRLPAHDEEEPLSTSHWFSRVAEKEVCLTGRYPVLMTRPAVHRLLMTPERGIWEAMSCAAEVVVSKPLQPDEIAGFQDDSCENWDIPPYPNIMDLAYPGRIRKFKAPLGNIKYPPED